MKRANHSCRLCLFALIVPDGICVDLFHTSSNTVDMPPDTPPQHKVSMPLRDTSPTSLALGPYSVRKSRISFYNFRDSVCCLTSLPVRLLKFPGVHDCATQGNLSSPEFSICTSGAQCFVSQQFTSFIPPVASSPTLSRSHLPAAPTGYLFAVAFALPSSIPPSNSSSRACDLATTQKPACVPIHVKLSVVLLHLPLKGLVARSGLSAGDGSTRKTGSAPKRALRFFCFRVQGFWVVLRIRFFEFSSSGAPWEKGFCGISGLVGLKVGGECNLLHQPNVSTRASFRRLVLLDSPRSSGLLPNVTCIPPILC